MIAVVAGVRPEIVKLAPVVHALTKRRIPKLVAYTNQHWLPYMSDEFFDEMQYRPDWRLPTFTAGGALDTLEMWLTDMKVRTVVVQGDTTTTCMAALAGMYAGCRIVHLEAGLRSGDPQMLEERHRLAVDHIAHELLTYTVAQAATLRHEQVRGRITLVGNPMVDVIDGFMPKQRIVWPGRWVYVTLHRREFTDNPERMKSVLNAIALGAKYQCSEIVCPMHPRTVAKMRAAGITAPFPVTAPIGVIESLCRIRGACVVVTDSGGVQEEAAIFGTPCVTVRENTERPETVAAGLNWVTGFGELEIVNAIAAAPSLALRRPRDNEPLYGPPGVGERVVDVIMEV